jgi:hypothetical protein
LAGLSAGNGRYHAVVEIENFPGGDLVREGLDDLSRDIESVPALLVSIGAPRLRRIGMKVPETAFPEPEHRLYEMLAKTDPDSAHSRYNALIRRLVSFERAAECVR